VGRCKRSPTKISQIRVNISVVLDDDACHQWIVNFSFKNNYEKRYNTELLLIVNNEDVKSFLDLVNMSVVAISCLCTHKFEKCLFSEQLFFEL
jgi:hypothetical protein